MHIFWKKSLVSIALFAMTLGGLLPFSAQAASMTALRVTTTGSGTFSMAPGEVKPITITFQNTGTTTWKNDGAGYISLYTHGPKYRKSTFDPGNWLSPSQVKRMKESSVAAKGVGTIVFDLRAPTTIGSYQETFALAAESVAWIDGGEFTLNITVKEATKTVAVTPTTTTKSSATLALLSANRLKLQAGKSAMITAGFKNTGTTSWTKYSLVAPELSIASGTSFAHASWQGDILASVTGTVRPSETAYLTFAIAAPSRNGTYTTKFQLTANGEAVDDAFVEIPVEVTGGAATAISAPITEEGEAAEEASYIEEPTIRVGVLIVDEETDNEVVITSTESDFEVRDIEGSLLAEMKQGERVTAYFDGTHYIFDRGQGSERSTSGLRFIPTTVNAVMTVANFDRRVTRGSSFADNTFRNTLELRHNTVKDRVWLINELKLEVYLRGLAETSNVSPIEYQKALLTAARTYAFYHWTRNTKHDGEYYHVDAWLDQVYKGYGQEIRAPKITQAVEATRGRIVTYEGAIAITPYFSRSDGRTRDWSEVWYGEVPWAKAVEVPCDAGKTLWGHGVGMSASGALCMANQGQMWDEILKHFYTGIDLDKKWE
ncbi:MAG: hypothetical protein NUV56_02920 [Candidatus Uhrbacteria bacterium]|nr:hypothetical protein [Candidatus Uhrbacteria bacterium]